MGILPFDNQALLSMRSGGYSFRDALCELIDNSIWHGLAKNTHINISWDQTTGQRMRLREVFVADDGVGMNKDILSNAVQIGKSTTFGSSENFGRFGYGLIAGALTQCQLVEIYSKQKEGDWNYIKYNFGKVSSGEEIPDPIEQNPSEEYVSDIGDGGTIVIWSGFDIAEPFDNDWDSYNIKGSKKGDLGYLYYELGRIYRKKIGETIVGTKNGKTEVIKNNAVRVISLNGNKLIPWDPLYFAKTPGLEDDPEPHEIFDELTFETDTHIIDKDRTGKDADKITIRMTILNRKWRSHNEKGVNPMIAETHRRHVQQNEGISVLRNGREVFYDHIPGVGPFPQRRFRYWGAEIDFPATLDQRFTVKNVKVGIRPDKDLTKKLHGLLIGPIGYADKEIQSTIKESKAEAIKIANVGPHAAAEGRFGDTAVGQDVDVEPIGSDEKEKMLDELLARVKKFDEKIDREKFGEIGVKFLDDIGMNENGPFIEVKNKLGNNIIVYNLKHPFFIHLDEIYKKLEELSDIEKIEGLLGMKLNEEQLGVRDEFQKEIDKTRYLIDLLLGSFAAVKGSMEVLSSTKQTVGSTVNTIISRWTDNLFTVTNDSYFHSRVDDEV